MIIRVSSERHLTKYLGTPAGTMDRLRQTADGLGFHFPAGNVEDGHAGFIIRPTGAPRPVSQRVKFAALVSYNPKLLELGVVSVPPVVTQGQEIILSLVAEGSKEEVSRALAELDYVFTIYITE